MRYYWIPSCMWISFYSKNVLISIIFIFLFSCFCWDRAMSAKISISREIMDRSEWIKIRLRWHALRLRTFEKSDVENDRQIEKLKSNVSSFSSNRNCPKNYGSQVKHFVLSRYIKNCSLPPYMINVYNGINEIIFSRKYKRMQKAARTEGF